MISSIKDLLQREDEDYADFVAWRQMARDVAKQVVAALGKNAK